MNSCRGSVHEWSSSIPAGRLCSEEGSLRRPRVACFSRSAICLRLFLVCLTVLDALLNAHSPSLNSHFCKGGSIPSATPSDSPLKGHEKQVCSFIKHFFWGLPFVSIKI